MVGRSGVVVSVCGESSHQDVGQVRSYSLSETSFCMVSGLQPESRTSRDTRGIRTSSFGSTDGFAADSPRMTIPSISIEDIARVERMRRKISLPSFRRGERKQKRRAVADSWTRRPVVLDMFWHSPCGDGQLLDVCPRSQCTPSPAKRGPARNADAKIGRSRMICQSSAFLAGIAYQVLLQPVPAAPSGASAGDEDHIGR